MGSMLPYIAAPWILWDTIPVSEHMSMFSIFAPRVADQKFEVLRPHSAEMC